MYNLAGAVARCQLLDHVTGMPLTWLAAGVDASGSSWKKVMQGVL